MTQNPYQSPAEPKTVSNEDSFKTRTFLGWCGIWMLVLGLNLPIPLLLATSVTDGNSWIGIGAALLLVVAMGVVLTIVYPKAIEALSNGGILTAASQLIPILHLFFGEFALQVCADLGLTQNPDDFMERVYEPTGGFLATLLTAMPLLMIAFCLGFVIAQWKAWRTKHPNHGPV